MAPSSHRAVAPRFRLVLPLQTPPGMTPLHMIREVPRRIESWPMIWKLLLCSTVSMTIAIVAFAWYAASRPKHCPIPTITLTIPKSLERDHRALRVKRIADPMRAMCARPVHPRHVLVSH